MDSRGGEPESLERPGWVTTGARGGAAIPHPGGDTGTASDMLAGVTGFACPTFNGCNFFPGLPWHTYPPRHTDMQPRACHLSHPAPGQHVSVLQAAILNRHLRWHLVVGICLGWARLLVEGGQVLELGLHTFGEG